MFFDILIFCIHIFIVQRIDLDFRSMRYIKIDIIISATASTCNVVLMRNSELSEGINVFDQNKKVVGSSKVAAKKALIETAVTRMVLPAPILIIPPVIMTMIEK